MEQFQQLYLRIQKKVSELEIKISELENEVQNLRSENTALKQENAKLKERLGLNSKNSSIPTSKELYKLKKENKEKSSHKQGGQAGHKGYSRDKMIADEIINRFGQQAM